MSGVVLSLLLLAAVLVAAVLRPFRLPEALVAVPAAAVAWSTGLVDTAAVAAELRRLAPVLVFLAAVLVLARLCAAEGVFTAAGQWLATNSAGSPVRLLAAVFALSAAVTSVLSLDATVVLLTPVVLATAGRMRLPATPYAYACGHLANSGSLLLPMGNLTNLLALAASGLTLAHFAAAMAAPWLVVLAVEYVALRWFFRAELAVPATSSPEAAGATGATVVTVVRSPVPWFAVGVLGVALCGFVATSFVRVAPFWVAVAAAAVLAVHTRSRRLITVPGLAAAADVPFLCFVLGLAVVVRAAVDQGLGAWVAQLVPHTQQLPALLSLAAVAAVLANVVNNLPALLVLLAPAAALGPMAVLAVLVGVNVGPNLTYTGSLATLLWRRVLRAHRLPPSLTRFTYLGLLTVPAGVTLGVLALWAAGTVLPFL